MYHLAYEIATTQNVYYVNAQLPYTPYLDNECSIELSANIFGQAFIAHFI